MTNSVTRRRMAGWGLLLAGLFAMTIQIGCSKDTTQPIGEFAPPTNLTYVNGTNQVKLSWSPSPDQGNSNFKEYAVYRSDSSMTGLSASALSGKRIASAGKANTYTDQTNVVLGHKYFYDVRSVNNSGDFSVTAGEIETAPRRESLPNSVAEFKYVGQPSGVNTANGQAVTMSSSNPDNRGSIDVYLGTTATDDAIRDQSNNLNQLAFKSPSLVNDGDSNWAARNSQLKFLDSWDTPTTTAAGWSDQVSLGTTEADVKAKVIAVRTPTLTDGSYHYAKMRITAMSGDPGQRILSVQVAYQEIPKYIRFSH